MKPLKEGEIQRQILDYLALKKVFHYRNNSGALKTERGGFVRFGAAGSPDIVCVINGRYLGIEIKTSKGVLSKAQTNFAQRLEMAGGAYLVARDLDDVIQTIRK